MMRHVVPVLSAISLLAAGMAAVSAINRNQPGAGWVLIALPQAGPALHNARLQTLQLPGATVVGIAPSERLLVLRVASMQRARQELPNQAIALWLGSFRIPAVGCG